MKRLFAILFIGALIMTGVMSCQDELEERYTNPDQTSEASIGKFFTKMLNNDRVRPSYWNVRTFLVMHPGLYAQSVSYTNANRRYQQQLSYIDDFWRDYYTPAGSGIVAHLREMEKAYAALPAEEQAGADVFMTAASVIYADQTSQMVDLWGDIPFSEAGQLNLTGESTAPKFDDASEIYATLLTQLEDAADYFATTQLESTVSAAFAKQDILLEGNMMQWRRYANSLRLRLLMRISFQDEAKAQTDVMTMLNNPDTYPLIDDAAYDVLLEPLTTYNNDMRGALTEVTSHIAPEFLLDDILKPANDPRIRVWFDKNSSGGIQNQDYVSMPSDLSSTEQETNISQGKYAILDSATFLINRAFPGIVINSAEVNFLKAEAFQRWGSTADAQAAYEQGVTDAVNFMFYLNSLGNGTEEDVTAEEMNNLLTSPSVAYTGTNEELLEKIWTQKWLSFGFMQSTQSWAEVRRTDTPSLTFLPDPSTPDSELPPSRLLYPSSEITYNAANYEEVASDDTATGKIFWDVK
jgi:hypothetical protein